MLPPHDMMNASAGLLFPVTPSTKLKNPQASNASRPANNAPPMKEKSLFEMKAYKVIPEKIASVITRASSTSELSPDAA